MRLGLERRRTNHQKKVRKEVSQGMQYLRSQRGDSIKKKGTLRYVEC